MFIVRGRKSWDARSIPVTYQAPSTVHTFVLHHTVTYPAYVLEDVKDALKYIEHLHMDERGWNGPGYNAIVDRRGRVWEARGLKVVGAGATGHNTGYFHCALLGNYEHIKPTLRQRTAVRLLKARLRTKGFKIRRTVGHNQLSGHESNACPGKHNTKAFGL